MFGAYPTWPDRAGYAIDTNVKELIDAQKPLVHERGDPDDPTLAQEHQGARARDRTLIAPFVTPEQLHEYDLIVHPVSGAQALGDPHRARSRARARRPRRRAGRASGWRSDIYGVVAKLDAKTKEWTRRRRGDAAKRDDDPRGAQGARRAVPRLVDSRSARRSRASENMDAAVPEMWRSSMALSPSYGEELRAFWQLPDDFTF